MIDSHCHLDVLPDPELAAAEPGLEALISIGASPEHARAAAALAERLDNVWFTAGLHPTDAERDSPELRVEIEALASHRRCVGIGESGIDYYWDAASPESQQAAMFWQLDLARSLNKPIIIHTRDKDGKSQAFDDCASLLEHAGWSRGILHCFAGNPRLLEAGLALGFYVSFAGNLTYKNAQLIRDAALQVPLDRLLVETDAPYLAPMPHRGKANRPAFVRFTLERLAELYGLEFAQMETITSDNARAIYQLPIK